MPRFIFLLTLLLIIGLVRADIKRIRRQRSLVQIDTDHDASSAHDQDFFDESRRILFHGEESELMMREVLARLLSETSLSASVPPSQPTTPPPVVLPPVPPPTPEVTVPTAPTEPTVPSIPTPTPAPPTTPAPFVSCTSEARPVAIRNIVQEKITPTADLDDPTTPQALALVWITDTDDMQVDPCAETDKLLTRYALAVLYYATAGPTAWQQNTDWLTVVDECGWYGVLCDDSGKVTSLQLDQNNLVGTLPNEIHALSDVEVLNLFTNSLTGPIPTVLGKLTKLVLFDVEQNALNGPAFVDLSSNDDDDDLVLSLQSYFVSFNDLTGTIPADGRYSSNLVNLKELWFAGNAITGTIPAAIGDSEIESFIAYDNFLTGPLPAELGNLDMTVFHVHGNAMEGPVPDSFWNNVRLRDLRLEQNQFSGTISSAIGGLTELSAFRAGDNSFSGTLPEEITQLSTLMILSVNGTKLSGSIPDSFGAFDRLQFVDLSNCLFTGPLPASVFDLPSLELLYLNGNQLTATIPANYANAPVLRDLYINDNQISGTVPAIEDGQFSVLTELFVENNNLIGSIPASICALRGDNEENELVRLTADCLGTPPEIVCDCCTTCF